MSEVKLPQEKIGLARDRHNLYGECLSSSRKNIRRGKQRSHKELRRAASQELLHLRRSDEELRGNELEARTRSKILAATRSSFKKKPDKPLREAIAHKTDWRSRRAQCH